MRSRPPSIRAAALLLLVLAGPLAADDLGAFRDVYRELVETDTTFSSGSCTAAAEKMALRLRDAGLPASDVHVVVAPDHPREGNLVAVLRAPQGGSHDKGVLLLAHIDVVEARREDWTRDPFRLAEEDGYFHGRGVADDKAMAASADAIGARRPRLSVGIGPAFRDRAALAAPGHVSSCPDPFHEEAGSPWKPGSGTSRRNPSASTSAKSTRFATGARHST